MSDKFKGIPIDKVAAYDLGFGVQTIAFVQANQEILLEILCHLKKSDFAEEKEKTMRFMEEIKKGLTDRFDKSVAQE